VAVRAPNLTEGYLPPSGTYFNVTDPCDASEINANINRVANCTAQGIDAGVFVANANSSIAGTISGNPKLKPEISQSYTIGGVFEPRFLRNFSMTVDYYNINIKHAITQVSAQDIVDNCYDSSAGLDPLYCSLFTRDPTTQNINFIRSTYINASALQTDGLEVQANYSFWADPSRFAASTHADLPAKITTSIDVNYLMHLRNFPFENDPSQLHILEGTVGYPQFRMLAQASYEQGPITFNWTVRYVDRSARFDKDPTQADFAESISPAYVPAEVYNDLSVHYRLPTPGSRIELYVGATDIFNVIPPIDVVEGNPNGADGSALYDFGRYVYAGVRMKY
jgi:outer membrane receptor protein involved in Fe transport